MVNKDTHKPKTFLFKGVEVKFDILGYMSKLMGTSA